MMNSSKKICSLILAISMLLGCFGIGVAVSAATPSSQTVKVCAGESVTLQFSENPCYGVDGTITYSNRSLFSAVTPASSPYGQVRENIFILSNASQFDCQMNLTVTVKDSAAVGDRCTVIFTYLRVDNNQTLEGPEGLVKSITVEVIEKVPEPTTSSTTSSTTTSTTSTTTTSTTSITVPTSSSQAPVVNTTKAPESTTTKKPVTTTTKKVPTSTTKKTNVDLTELNLQITSAEGLTSSDYSADSWSNLSAALVAATKARSEKDQAKIDAAANALKEAIAALRKNDAGSLQEQINSVREFLNGSAPSMALDELNQAIAEAEDAGRSGDEEKISSASTRLNEAFAAYKKAIEDLTKKETVEVEVEKIVEVEPSGPWCNIWYHYLWHILLIISFFLNVAFIVYYFYKRNKEKENKKDQTVSNLK